MAKVISIKKSSDIQQLKEKRYATENNIGISAHKYSGKITPKEDVEEYQQQTRDEWN